jgi:hypothetical protein
MTTTQLPKPRKVRAGWYEVDAVGQTFTIQQVSERHESLNPWHVTDETERFITEGRTLAEAVDLLARWLSR